MVVVGLGYDFLFIFLLAHCVPAFFMHDKLSTAGVICNTTMTFSFQKKTRDMKKKKDAT